MDVFLAWSGWVNGLLSLCVGRGGNRRAVEEFAGGLDSLLMCDGVIARQALQFSSVLERELGDVEFEFFPVEGVALFGEGELAISQLEVMEFGLGVFVALQPLVHFGECIRVAFSASPKRVDASSVEIGRVSLAAARSMG
jgi:hypothetical protein